MPEAERLQAEALPAGFRLFTPRFGFAEAPDVLAGRAELAGFDPEVGSFLGTRSGTRFFGG